MRVKRSHKQDKLAKLYDAEILPIWSQRFGRLLLRDLTVPPKAMILDVGAGTGYPALEVVKRIDEQSRIIAIDPSSSMLDIAREKAGPLSGKRIFFRSETAEPRLSFANDVYDLVIANLSMPEMQDPPVVARELGRVAKPGGRVVATLPLAGTFDEFHDLYREVLIKKDRADALKRLEAHLVRQPSVELARRWFEDAGLLDVTVETETFTLLFKSSREFFFAPLIEYGPLIEWKQIAGTGAEMQDVFWNIKAAIDAYWSTSSFSVTVVAGCVRGRKPTEDEMVPDDETSERRVPVLGAPSPREGTNEIDVDEVVFEDVEDLEPEPGDDEDPFR